MPSAYISLGSNLGDRLKNLLRAIERIRESGLDVKRLSQIYETEPVGSLPQPQFLNMVAELHVDSSTTPEALLSQLLQIEQELGRTRDIEKGPRTIDLDLLFFGSELRNTESLQLPHPRLHERRFVLVPLAELNSNLEHPVLHRTMAELLQTTSDTSAVNLYAPSAE